MVKLRKTPLTHYYDSVSVIAYQDQGWIQAANQAMAGSVVDTTFAVPNLDADYAGNVSRGQFEQNVKAEAKSEASAVVGGIASGVSGAIWGSLIFPGVGVAGFVGGFMEGYITSRATDLAVQQVDRAIDLIPVEAGTDQNKKRNQ